MVVLVQNAYLLVARVNDVTKISNRNKTELPPHTIFNWIQTMYKIRNGMLKWTGY